MKVTHKAMVEKDFIDDILCNKCGESCINDGAPSPEGLVEVRIRGGYGAQVLCDGDDFTFSLCERCLAKIMVTFDIPPEYANSIDSRSDFEAWREWTLKTLEDE